MQKYTQRTLISLSVICIFVSAWLIRPQPAHAQLGGLLGCSSTSVSLGQKVPVQDSSTDAMKNVQCTWNGLAYSVAKIALQEVTSSVVNWINSGFQGNPSFITNPGAFFANTADQITGAFIANTGVLSQLCSPFNIDIRLNLALQGQAPRTRYTCTLNTIIKNVQNSKITGGVTLNGSTIAQGSVSGNGSMQGFLNGDFNQGGWPAFISMTTEPQNNVYGAYLKAKSDLEQQIANKQNNIKVDLNMGRGFLSYKSCTDVNADTAELIANNAGGSVQQGTISSNSDFQSCMESGGDAGTCTSMFGNTSTTQNAKDYQACIASGNTDAFCKSVSATQSAGTVSMSTGQDYYSGSDYSLQSKTDANGKTTYQDCETQTPGSVIAGSIDKTLGIPQDTLNLANSINEIVNALFAQLVTKVLTGGLHTASNSGASGNVTSGVATQLLQQKQVEQIQPVRDQFAQSTQDHLDTARQLVNLRQQQIDAIFSSRSSYDSAKLCFQQKVVVALPSASNSASINYANNQIVSIETSAKQVDATLAQYQTLLSSANSRLNSTQNILDTINSAQSVDQLNGATSQYDAANQGGNNTTTAFVSAADITLAQNDLKAAQDLANGYAQESAQYMRACQAFTLGGSVGGF